MVERWSNINLGKGEREGSDGTAGLVGEGEKVGGWGVGAGLVKGERAPPSTHLDQPPHTYVVRPQAVLHSSAAARFPGACSRLRTQHTSTYGPRPASPMCLKSTTGRLATSCCCR